MFLPLLKTQPNFLYVEQLNEWYAEESFLPFRPGAAALVEYIVNVYRERCGTFVFHDIRDEPTVFAKNLVALRNNFIFNLLAEALEGNGANVLERCAGKLSASLSRADHAKLINAFLLSHWLPSRVHDQFARRYRQELLDYVVRASTEEILTDQSPREITPGEIPALCSRPCVNRILSFDSSTGSFKLHLVEEVLRNIKNSDPLGRGYPEAFVKRIQERFN